MRTRADLIFKQSRKQSFSTTDIDERNLMEAWAQEGVHDVLLKTRCRVQLGDLTLIVNESEYRLDNEILAMEHAFLPGSQDKIAIISFEEILEYKRIGISPGSKMFIAIEGSFAMVAPIPKSAQVIRYIFVPKPTAMSDDSHDWTTITYGGIPEEYGRAIEYYMLWQGAEYDDRKVPLTVREYRDLYLGEIQEIKKAHRRKGGNRRRSLVPGYPDQLGGSGRNDTYP